MLTSIWQRNKIEKNYLQHESIVIDSSKSPTPFMRQAKKLWHAFLLKNEKKSEQEKSQQNLKHTLWRNYSLIEPKCH